MAKGPAEIIMGVLRDRSIADQGSASAWRLGTGAMTNEPDQQIVCVDSPGQSPDPKWLLDYPAVQILVRGIKGDYQQAHQKIKDCYDVLLGCDPIDVTDGRIDGITALATPSFIGLDGNERPVFTSNYRLIFEPAASTLSNREPL